MLSHLKELQVLVVSSIWGRPVPQLINLFTSCKKLKQIHCFLDSGNYQTYGWTMESLDVQSTLTTFKEVHRWWRV